MCFFLPGQLWGQIHILQREVHFRASYGLSWCNFDIGVSGIYIKGSTQPSLMM